MMLFLGCALRRVLERVGGQGRDGEDRRRRAFLVLALAVTIPALLAYGLADLVRGEPLQAAPALVLVLLLSATLAVARRLSRLEAAARVIIPVGLACLACEIVAGGAGAVFLWAYLLPVGVFFIFGWREGGLWAALIGLVTGGLLAVGPRAYPPALVTRFFVTYLLVTLFSSALEATRAASSRALLARQGELEEALRKIRTLSGLLPICCSCKKIRNDHGAWSPLEDYLEAHTQAELTHGICPECMGELYPEAVERIRRRSEGGCAGVTKV